MKKIFLSLFSSFLPLLLLIPLALAQFSGFSEVKIFSAGPCTGYSKTSARLTKTDKKPGHIARRNILRSPELH
jgi:hypothetical protein